MTPQPSPDLYPGQRLGLPADGPGSVAGWGRRIAALFIAWLASTLVAIGFTGLGGWLDGTVLTESMPLIVFFVEVSLLTAITGSSFGQLAVRVAVVPVVSPFRALSPTRTCSWSTAWS